MKHRNKGRTFAPEVLMLINDAIDSGAGAKSIRLYLERKLPGVPIPSARSIQNYRNERLDEASR